MADYEFSDGAKMKWNVLIPKKQSVLETYPDLAAIFEDMREQLISVDGMKSDEIVRYICLVYHLKSPLIQREENLMQRKKRAMQIVGMTIDAKGFFSQPINAIIANQNLATIDLIFRFLRFENNIDWCELCALTELYYDYQKVISEETVGTDKKTAADIMDRKLAARTKSKGLKDEMNALSLSVFKGDIDLRDYVGSTIVREDIRLRLTPESRARK